MTYSFPNRNEARAILKAISFAKNDISIKRMTKSVIRLYKETGMGFEFVFTNALVDMYQEANVDTENAIDGLVQMGFHLQTPEDFFKNEVGFSFEEILNQYKNHNSDYEISFSSNHYSELDFLWFNNSDKFIHPLISAYLKFKKNKGMLVQEKDVKQIVIDYSIILCYNHFKQKGFIAKNICSLIIQELVDAANNSLNTTTINHSDIEYIVFKNLESPSEIRVAFDFIRIIGG